MEGVEFGRTSAITEMAELEEQKTEIKCSVSLDMRDGIEKLVESGRFSTISDAVEIALEGLIHKIENEPYARYETRYEITKIADAYRAKMRGQLI